MLTLKEYIGERRSILKKEEDLFVGSSLTLNENESKLNLHILALKNDELVLAYRKSENFTAKKHFFECKNDIENSKIFKILRKLPKGHSLHNHLEVGASIDFIVENFSHKDNIYGKFINDQFKLKFLTPDDAKEEGWVLLKEMRKTIENFDEWLKKKLSLIVENPHESYPSLESAWKQFRITFRAACDMLTYKPAFEEYYYQCLKELYDDNVMYGEFRANPLLFYDLDGNKYKIEDFFEALLDVETKFKKDHPDFIGARYIHSIYRKIPSEILKNDIKVILEMKEKFPKLIVGFDFVGFEEEGRSLLELYEYLRDVSGKLDFFFHAGETNWFGHTDSNLVDAVLLKAKRIGHGFSISKHPELMKLILEQNIAIELCPISNQVLMLNEDPRNHPVVSLLAKGFPVVVCNDDPASWGVTGLSYDWYVTFLAMTPKNCGLKVLKQFALNSIQYSALDDVEKKKAKDVWLKRWDEFVSEMIKEI